jgi:hypothetical protein
MTAPKPSRCRVCNELQPQSPDVARVREALAALDAGDTKRAREVLLRALRGAEP